MRFFALPFESLRGSGEHQGKLRMTDMRHGRESSVICLDYWIPDYKRRE